jgi:diguanylate cyclase (GGDEF)-like protein
MGESKKQIVTGVFKLKGEVSETLLENFGKMVTSLNRSNEQLKQYKKMEELVYTDDVTGLFNQRKLNKDLDSALIKHRQIRDKFSILFIDIDHFKSVNDGHGHLVGTKILFDLASLLNCAVRESDYIYRYGGDEFVVLIPNTGPEIAKKIGDRILNTVKSHTFEVKRPGSQDLQEFKLTVSIGVASFPQDAKSREDILEIADQMMYQAKKTGRGRVCFTHDIFDTTVLGEEKTS